MSQADKLAEAFDRSVLSEKPKGGKRFTYVPAAEVVARMNHVLGPGNWGVSVAEAFRDGDDWVIGRATVWAVIDGNRGERSAYGGQEINRYGKDHTLAGKPIDLGDDYKGALTDAVKKACQSFGVALDLARSEDAIAAEVRAEQTAQALAEAARDGGWESAEQRTSELDSFIEEVKASEAGERMKAFRAEHGFDWPPTREQLLVLRSELETLQQPFEERPFSETAT